MPVEKILDAELAVEPNNGPYVDTPVSLQEGTHRLVRFLVAIGYHQ